MKPRRIYYRRKNKGIVIEGKSKGKSILIWTLPKNPEKLLAFLGRQINDEKSCTNLSLDEGKKAFFLNKEKWLKIKEKVRRLDYRSNKS